MTDVFISYARRNLEFVQKLGAALVATGKSIWFDQNDQPLQGIPVGSRWWDEIKQGIESADNFLYVISQYSVISPYCNAEVEMARSLDKRIVPILHCGDETQQQIYEDINNAIDAIEPQVTIPSFLRTDEVSLLALARRNWLEISLIQYIVFDWDEVFESSFKQVLQAIDLDLIWIRAWSQCRQAIQLWAENGYHDDYRWPEKRLKPIREMVAQRNYTLSDVENEFIRPEHERLLNALTQPDCPDRQRSLIGQRLAVIGDPRLGVGVHANGFPIIDWCFVPKGMVPIERQLYAVSPFFIAKYPVTFTQFKAFIDDPQGYANDVWWEGADVWKRYRQGFSKTSPKQRFQFDNYPRENVDWFTAVAYCRWLQARLPSTALPSHDNLSSDSLVIRLPAEWEWIQAAMGGHLRHLPFYVWGTNWETGRANTSESGIGQPTAVGMFPGGSASCGALDMLGNIWEWCLNEYENTDQSTIHPDTGKMRTAKGGSWAVNKEYARIAVRMAQEPITAVDTLGFRVCYAPAIPHGAIQP